LKHYILNLWFLSINRSMSEWICPKRKKKRRLVYAKYDNVFKTAWTDEFHFFKYSRKVVMHVLLIPHSNSFCETLFRQSLVLLKRWQQTWEVSLVEVKRNTLVIVFTKMFMASKTFFWTSYQQNKCVQGHKLSWMETNWWPLSML